MDLESISKEYFSSLNALAEKIATDIGNTQEAYQDLWHSLSKTEQNQAIDESIINPSAVIKYASLPVQALKQNYNSYSWFTKSQLNLYSKLDLMGYPDSGKTVICRSDADQISKEIMPNDKELKTSADGSLHKSKSSLSSTKTTEEKPKSQKSTVLKPKTPPPPPPPKISTAPSVEPEISKESDASADIPKTGFDFLDNW